MSQLQLAFLLIDTAVRNEIVGDNTTPATPVQFRRAQRLVRWTYQYLVWNDFVKRLVSSTMFNDVIGEVDKGVLKARRLYYSWKNEPYIQVERSVAAYRLGHAMVRNAYQINITSALSFGVHRPIFSMDGSPDLRGDPSSFFSVKPERKPDNEVDLRAVMGAEPVNGDWEQADIVSSIGVPLENADSTGIEAALATIDLTTPAPVP